LKKLKRDKRTQLQCNETFQSARFNNETLRETALEVGIALVVPVWEEVWRSGGDSD